MSLDSFTLRFRIHRDQWMTSNQRLHYQVKRRRTEALRTLAYVQTRNTLQHPPLKNLVPIRKPMRLTATIHLPTARRFDPPNAWPTVKALVDGVVDAGILPDDSSDEIPVTSFQRGGVSGDAGVYLVELTFTILEEEGR